MAILCPVPKAVYLGCGESSPITRHTDYFKPLHVDCSVEYELPSCAKPPSHGSSDGSRREPLLMIHPSYYRREEGRHRDPFIINLPTKLRSLEDWKTPAKTVKNRSSYAAGIRNSQHRKRMLDLSPASSCSSSTKVCLCGKTHSQVLPAATHLTTSSMSNDGCPCGEVHQPVVIEPVDATIWSNCGATIEDLRTDKRLAASSATVDTMHVKPDPNNNDCANGDINDKFRKLRRLQAYMEAKSSASSKNGVASNSSAFAMMAQHGGARHHDVGGAHSSADLYEVPIKKAKKDGFGVVSSSSSSSSSSFEYCVDPYARHHPLSVYEPQPAVAAAAPSVVPMTSHWNCGGYYRTAGTNAISTIVRGSENMWRLFQV